MLDYYNGSLVQALEDIYPDIGLRREMFASLHSMSLVFPPTSSLLSASHVSSPLTSAIQGAIGLMLKIEKDFSTNSREIQISIRWFPPIGTQ